MTFLSIGALVGGIYLMIYLTREKEKVVVPVTSDAKQPEAEASASAETGMAPGAGDRRRRAVAAAAAVALALQERPTQPLASALQAPAPEGWNGYVRGLHLSARSRYESRRTRR